jgi:pantothenate kinase
LLVGLSGIPASGKSSLAALIVQKTNDLLQCNKSGLNSDSGLDSNTSVRAILVGLDGWHLSRAQLDAFPDPKSAHDRRGAHWTFDGAAYVSFIRSLRNISDPDLDPTSITAPSFDHALKDPVSAAIAIHAHHRIVLIEGLYTFLAIEPWKEGGVLLDERWFLTVGVQEAKGRLLRRHVESGVARDGGEAVWMAEENDMPSGC